MAINAPRDCKVVVGWIVSEDDFVMRAHLRHKRDPDNNQDKGKLPEWIHEPKFLANPGHRLKAIAKHFYALATK